MLKLLQLMTVHAQNVEIKKKKKKPLKWNFTFLKEKTQHQDYLKLQVYAIRVEVRVGVH